MSLNVQKIRYHGTGGSLFELVLTNLMLRLITLGIYSFWAKTKVREFHYGATEFAGDRFAYHGTGGELFVGAIKASMLLVLLFGGMTLLAAIVGPTDPEAEPTTALLLVWLLFGLVFLVVFAIAITGGRRYRLARSSWRGVRFHYAARWQDYLRMMVKGGLLTIVTLTFYRPFFENQQRAFLVNHARFGTAPFEYDADARELFGKYLTAVLLTIPTLGLYWVWYAAFRHRYFWAHTSIGNARFRSNVQGDELLSLMLSNVLLVIVTLGFGMSWATVRTQRFWADSLALQGDVDWANVHQLAFAVSATGEGLAQGLDVDVDVGLAM